jgi:hypothetical protein
MFGMPLASATRKLAAIAAATQLAFRSSAKLHRSVKNLVGEMDQMFRRHRETRIASVGG